MRGISGLAEKLIASQEGPFSMEIVLLWQVHSFLNLITVLHWCSFFLFRFYVLDIFNKIQ